VVRRRNARDDRMDTLCFAVICCIIDS
jgi:hypothetical protein